MPLKPFRIKRYKHPRLKFVVRSKISGKWERKFFETKGEAETFVQQKEVELLNVGREGVTFPTWLRAQAQQAHDRLEPFGKTLLDAVDFFTAHLEATQRSVNVTRAAEELVANRKATGATQRYCDDLRQRLGRFARSFPERLVSTITTAELDDWLAALDVAAVTRNTFRRDLVTLFSFCTSRRYCTTNAALGARKAKELDGEIGILTVDEMRRLLAAADEQLIPFIAIGGFAGVRRAETMRMTWDEIHFDAKLIEIRARKSKTARRRFIKIQPNLQEWLRPYRRRRGPIVPARVRQFELAARAAAGIERWPSNALRHSFASYHLGHFKNAAELALEMGHTNQVLLFRHYRQLVRPGEAAKYWDLRPTTEPSS